MLPCRHAQQCLRCVISDIVSQLPKLLKRDIIFERWGVLPLPTIDDAQSLVRYEVQQSIGLYGNDDINADLLANKSLEGVQGGVFGYRCPYRCHEVSYYHLRRNAAIPHMARLSLPVHGNLALLPPLHLLGALVDVQHCKDAAARKREKRPQERTAPHASTVFGATVLGGH